VFASADEAIKWLESASSEEISCIQELDLRFLDARDWEERYQFHLGFPKLAAVLKEKGRKGGLALRSLGLTGVASSCLRE
jgi:hypothetical protein